MNKEVRTVKTIDGKEINFVSCDYLVYSDYSGDDVERSNVRILQEDFKDYIEGFSYSTWKDQGENEYSREGTYDNKGNRFHWEFKPLTVEEDTKAVEIYFDYGGIQLWIREDIDKEEEIMDRLEDYPCLDEEDLSSLELELEEEAFIDGYENDIESYIWTNDLFEGIEFQTDVLMKAYYQAKERENVYGHVVTGGNYYIDIERLFPVIVDILREGLKKVLEEETSKR
jgi:hypothetical protein